jgi:hypothetical protein
VSHLNRSEITPCLAIFTWFFHVNANGPEEGVSPNRTTCKPIQAKFLKDLRKGKRLFRVSTSWLAAANYKRHYNIPVRSVFGEINIVELRLFRSGVAYHTVTPGQHTW